MDSIITFKMYSSATVPKLFTNLIIWYNNTVNVSEVLIYAVST
jgi:hypothetical protein